MRGEDRPAKMASLDQQAFLRQVLRAIRSNTIAARNISSDRFAGRWSVYRTRNETQTITTRDRATRPYTRGAELIERRGDSHN